MPPSEADRLARETWAPERVIPDDWRERTFLLERYVNGDLSWVGLSSGAMVWHAIMGAHGLPRDWPMDVHDLGRCEETYWRAPEHLRPRMLPILVQFRRHVAERGLYCWGCDTNGHSGTAHGLCTACRKPEGGDFPLEGQ